MDWRLGLGENRQGRMLCFLIALLAVAVSTTGVLILDSVPALAARAHVSKHQPVTFASGYWLVGSDGGVFSFGFPFYGSEGGKKLNKPVVGMASAPSASGYWLAAADGGVFSFGSAGFHGSLPSIHVVPSVSVSGIAATPDGGGYWLVGGDGGVFSFGDAKFFGSLPSIRVTPSAPIVGIASTPDGKGYWLVGSDGGIFSFGDAGFYGSFPGKHPFEFSCATAAVNLPCTLPSASMTPSNGGLGYWIAFSEGSVIPYGEGTNENGLGSIPLAAPIVGIAANPLGTGYWLVGADGGVFSNPASTFMGSLPGMGIHVSDIVGMASSSHQVPSSSPPSVP